MAIAGLFLMKVLTLLERVFALALGRRAGIGPCLAFQAATCLSGLLPDRMLRRFSLPCFEGARPQGLLRSLLLCWL